VFAIAVITAGAFAVAVIASASAVVAATDLTATKA
jgi:hypothetical protein